MPDTPPSLFVTKTFVPGKEEFYRYLDTMFATRTLTNNGTIVRELEKKLAGYLGVPEMLACANGTLSLMLVIRAAGLSGKKVVTTPFTYVATLSALLWEGCTPVFADIDPETMCLSPDSLRDCLERHPDVAGVVPVHVYGNACDVDVIDALCREKSIVCLYDACQAFGVEYHGRSLLDYGDYAACSFHSTKIFHTVEGGGIVVHNEDDAARVRLLRACGHIGDEHICLGLNAKLSEMHAAMGLAILPHVADLIAARRKVTERYESLLPCGEFERPKRKHDMAYNYSYFPIVLDSEKTLLSLCNTLARAGIHPRRYFYPSLTTLPYLPDVPWKNSCPHAEDIAPRTLCLPLSAETTDEDVDRVASAVGRFFTNKKAKSLLA